MQERFRLIEIYKLPSLLIFNCTESLAEAHTFDCFGEHAFPDFYSILNGTESGSGSGGRFQLCNHIPPGHRKPMSFVSSVRFINVS